MNAELIVRKSAVVLILFSILFVFSACAGDPPGTHRQLEITYKENTSPYWDRIDPYRYFCILKGSNEEEPSLSELLPEIKKELPSMAAGAQYKVNLPDYCDSEIDCVNVLLTLPSGEITQVSFTSVEEAVAYAEKYPYEQSVIDLVLTFSGRGFGCFKESGREGYAFMLDPNITDRDRLIVYTIDNETGEYSEHEAYCHMLYASSSNGESFTEIDCASLFDLLPSVREELPEISASRNEIGFYLPTLYAASFKKAEVFLTLPSGEIMTVDFNTLSEALSYAREHFSEGEEAPVIDVIMYFKNRDAGVRGTETGEEGYAFKLIP